MVHVEGKLGNVYVRESTGTRVWSQALSLVRTAERLGTWEKPKKQQVESVSKSGKLLSEAIQEYLSDCASAQGKNLSSPTMSKYKTILGRLEEYCVEHGYRTLDNVTFPVLQAYRRTWMTGPQATANNIARLRSFFKFAVKSGYVQQNVALDLETPRNYSSTERLPYTEEEMNRILEAARTLELDPQQPATNEEIETFILVQRYGGLAMADAALLQASELRRDEIRYFRKKTSRSANRQLVVVPIPDFVMAKLKALPLQRGRYFFCHGSDHLVSVTDVWQSRLRQVFEEAKIVNAGSHRFRHTFATSLLTQGVSIELVSRWLGHASIKVTEKHYSHFLENRIQAASDVLRDIYATIRG